LPAAEFPSFEPSIERSADDDDDDSDDGWLSGATFYRATKTRRTTKTMNTPLWRKRSAAMYVDYYFGLFDV